MVVTQLNISSMMSLRSSTCNCYIAKEKNVLINICAQMRSHVLYEVIIRKKSLEIYFFFFRDLKKNINLFIISVNLLVCETNTMNIYRTNTMDISNYQDRAKVGLIKLNDYFFIISSFFTTTRDVHV